MMLTNGDDLREVAHEVPHGRELERSTIARTRNNATTPTVALLRRAPTNSLLSMRWGPFTASTSSRRQ